MNRILRVLLVCAFFLALPLAAETLNQCVMNCPPGVNACMKCCMSQYDAASGPCFNSCAAASSSCFSAAWASCKSDPNPQACYAAKSAPCLRAQFDCQRNCDNSVQIAGGCPGEVPPQKCPYNCQMWNPASQSCIGPAMNVCGSAMAAAETTADLYAERAKASADAAEAQTQKLQDEMKAKAKAKSKSKKK